MTWKVTFFTRRLKPFTVIPFAVALFRNFYLNNLATFYVRRDVISIYRNNVPTVCWCERICTNRFSNFFCKHLQQPNILFNPIIACYISSAFFVQFPLKFCSIELEWNEYQQKADELTHCTGQRVLVIFLIGDNFKEFLTPIYILYFSYFINYTLINFVILL